MAQGDWCCLCNAGTQVQSPGLEQLVEDPVLPQLWRRSQLQLGSDPWLGTSICHGVVKNENKNGLLSDP